MTGSTINRRLNSLYSDVKLLRTTQLVALYNGLSVYKTPYYLTQDDSYGNLMIIHESIHRLNHLKDLEKIQMLLKEWKLDEKQLLKVNELRKQKSERYNLISHDNLAYT